MASRTVLIASGPFAGKLDAAAVAAAIARGLSGTIERGRGAGAGEQPAAAGGVWEIDTCPIAQEGDPAQVRGLLDGLRFDVRMRAAHAVVVVAAQLDHTVLQGSAAFEIATRARQGGVPAYAITAANELDLFEARILDLQLILEADSERALLTAGTQLAKLI